MGSKKKKKGKSKGISQASYVVIPVLENITAIILDPKPCM